MLQYIINMLFGLLVNGELSRKFQLELDISLTSGVFKGGGGHGSLSPPRDVGKKCALPVINQ